MNAYLSHDRTVEQMKQMTPLFHFDGSKDLAKWQAEAREKLKELLCLPLEGVPAEFDDQFVITSDTVKEEFREICFEFQSEPGYTVPTHLLIPLGAEKPLPGMICLQGHSSGKHISLGEGMFEDETPEFLESRCFAVQAVRNGFCAIVFDQRYMGNAGRLPDGRPTCLRNWTALSAMMLGRTAVGERVHDISRAIDMVEKYFTAYVDTDKMMCLGTSGGGTATFYASCLEDRIKLAVVSAALCTFEASIMDMFHCACNYIPGMRKYFNMGDLGCMIAPKKLVVTSGDVDNIFPLHGAVESFEIIKTAYEKAGLPENCRMLVGHGGHAFFPDLAWPAVRELLDK